MDAVTLHLPEPWILRRYLVMLHRALRAARAHARGTHGHVIAHLNEGIELTLPNPFADDPKTIAHYLRRIYRIIIATRYSCTSMYDEDGRPFGLIKHGNSTCPRARFPACEAAESLLDAIHNVPDLLMQWHEGHWCTPRMLFNELRYHEEKYEKGMSRFTGYLSPVDQVAPSTWSVQDAPG